MLSNNPFLHLELTLNPLGNLDVELMGGFFVDSNLHHSFPGQGASHL